MDGSERETCACDPRTLRIRQLNDQLRQTGQGGSVPITQGVQALGPVGIMQLVQAVRGFSDFAQANDPHAEHDMGSVTLPSGRFFWKIDYYDRALLYGSPDPADPEVTSRVLTIMRSDEY